MDQALNTTLGVLDDTHTRKSHSERPFSALPVYCANNVEASPEGS
jgi:hypothetical protein